MSNTIRETLQKPCLIERTEGVVIVEPLQFFRIFRRHDDRRDHVCRLPA